MGGVSTGRCLWPLICPVCEDLLTESLGVIKCAQGHSFDIAREGYVNLLLSGKKVPEIMGDAKPMLRARRRFLEAGHYLVLSDKLNELVIAQPWQLVDRTPLTIIDAGCGEGYYSGRLGKQLAQKWPELAICTFGVDIAKEAARLGSKRYSHTRFVVADIRRKLPFADHSAQVMLNVFAPRNVVEFSRLSAWPGLVLVVIPSESHLAELRSQVGLMRIEKEKQQQIVAQWAGRFELEHIEPISFEMILDQEQLFDLVQMTPNYWHLTEASQQALEEMESMEVAASFEILLFRHLSPGASRRR
jgi:23S rRNA (guanine745-N1)-methyltransferase